MTGKFNLTTDSVYHLRVEIGEDGTRVQTYIDGTLIDDRRGDFPYGQLGFRASKAETSDQGENSYWDNLKVTVEGQTAFSADFEQSNPFDNGTVTGGRLYLQGHTNPDVYAWLKQTDSGDTESAAHYVLESDLTLVEGNAGFVFAYTASNTYNMWAVNCKDQTYPLIRRHRYDNGNLTYDDSRVYGFTKAQILGTKHRVRIEVEGKTVSTYIDTTLVDTYTAQANVSDGAVGFRFHADDGGPFYIDNVVLKNISSDGEESVILSEDFEGTNALFDGTITEKDGSKQLLCTASSGEAMWIDNTVGNANAFRKEFTAAKAIRSAKLYSSALGIYDVYINGQRVGHLQDDGTTIYDELKPGWTDFSKKVFYISNDVTSLLRQGGNVIAANVSPGYWSGNVSHGQYGTKELAFRCKLLVTYEDDSQETVVSDLSWAASSEQALRMGDIYNGETYDARLGTSWMMAGYDDSQWNAVTLSRDFTGDIVAFEGSAVRIREDICRAPQKVRLYEGTDETDTTYGMLHKVSEQDSAPFSMKKGQTAVIDFGQNMVGWVSFKVKGDTGCRMRVRFCEMLNETGDPERGEDGPGGSPYLVHLRTAKATLYYTLAGAEEGESYRPAHTYFGFRYCEITATGDITVEALSGEVVGSENMEGSSLTTSDTAVNQLISNVMWGQRGNFVSIPTDCPQRDERLGWTGDTEFFCRTATYNANTAAFYHKFMGDMRDSQSDEGGYPSVAPVNWGVGYGEGAWADCGIILPWTVYLMYGDTTIIEENYESMEKYMDFLSTKQGDGYLYNGPGTAYGDWLSYVSTDSRYVSVCYYAYDAQLMAKMSRVLSASADDTYAQKATKYEELYENIKTEFASRYIDSDTQMPEQTTQTSCLLALRMGLCPSEESRQKTIQQLEDNITDNDEKLNTGFVGTAILCPTLSEVGLNDKAYNLLLQRDNPSWLYSVDQGATTIWERWDSYTKEGGISKNIEMNSFNHYSFGAVEEWMYRFMAGIEADEQAPGFKHFILQPTPDTRETLPAGQERVTHVAATFRSPYGDIKSEWQLDGDNNLTYSCTVPANTTATLYLPLTDDANEMSEVLGASDEDMTFKGITDHNAVYELQSGDYKFVVSGATSIDVVEKQGTLTVYPNPTGSTLNIECGGQVESLTLYTSAGNAVKSEEVQGNGKTIMDMAGLPNGVYLLSACTFDGKQVVKVVKK